MKSVCVYVYVESDLCNFDDDADLDFSSSKENGEESCHFAGACSTAVDCGHQCEALGHKPNAVKCVLDFAAGENRCCCIKSRKNV
jgi:hypothetical protein